MGANRGKVVTSVFAAAGSIVLLAGGGIIGEDYLARRSLLDRIAALDAAVPLELTDMAKVDDIRRDAERCADLCRDLLARWPRSDGAWATRGTLVRMLRMLDGCAKARPAAGGPGDERAQREREARAGEAVDLARQVIGRPELRAAQRHAALEVLLERDPASLGGLEGIPKLLVDLRAAYSRDAAALPIGPERERLESRGWDTVYLRHNVYLALGDRESFVRSLAPGSTSYVLTIFDRYIGRTAEADLTGARWVTDAHFDLKAARGAPAVLMVVGTGTGGDRLQALGKLVDGRRAQGVTGAVFTYLPENAAKRTEQMERSLRADLDKGGVKLPAALISVDQLKALFPRGCSGTCVVLDREGKFVWETILIPPPSREWSLTQLVLDRCLSK